MQCPGPVKTLATMSDMTYSRIMSPNHKPLVWLRGEVKSPPFSHAAELEAGYLLRQLQAGLLLSLPHSRPMPSISVRCHELRIVDEGKTWRLIYRIDADAIVLAEVFAKHTQTTPRNAIVNARKRLAVYDKICGE